MRRWWVVSGMRLKFSKVVAPSRYWSSWAEDNGASHFLFTDAETSLSKAIRFDGAVAKLKLQDPERRQMQKLFQHGCRNHRMGCSRVDQSIEPLKVSTFRIADANLNAEDSIISMPDPTVEPPYTNHVPLSIMKACDDLLVSPGGGRASTGLGRDDGGLGRAEKARDVVRWRGGRGRRWRPRRRSLRCGPQRATLTWSDIPREKRS